LIKEWVMTVIYIADDFFNEKFLNKAVNGLCRDDDIADCKLMDKFLNGLYLIKVGEESRKIVIQN
jgi:hypothetical protein